VENMEVMEAYPEKMDTDKEPMEAEIKTGLIEVEGMDVEVNPEEKEVVAEQKEDPKEGAAVETVGALGDRYLAVGCLQQPKKWTQGNGGSRKKLATARRRMTRCAVSARHKERSHKRLTVEKMEGPGI
jgi:hypothetical protein